jgi:hypothetical protein
MDDPNTAVRIVLESVYPDVELNEEVVLKVIEYCRREELMDQPQYQTEDGRTWRPLESMVPHLYGILTEEG